MVRSPSVPAKTEQNEIDLESRLAHLEAELIRERRISQALREVSLAIGSVSEIDPVLELILSKITEVLDADRATLYLLNSNDNTLDSRVVVGGLAQTIRVRVGRGIAGVVARTGKPIRVKDAYRDKRFMRDWDILTGYRTRSILAAPMKNHVGRIIGVVQALNKHGGESHFTEEDESLLMALAQHAAVTVDNMALFIAQQEQNKQLVEIKEQLEHRVRDLDLLFTIESSMARASSIEALLQAALSEATGACGARAGAVLLPASAPTEDGFGKSDGAGSVPAGMATLYFFERDAREKLRTVLSRPNEGFIGWIYQNGVDATSTEVEYDTKSARRLDAAFGFQTGTAIGAPLDGQEGDRCGAIALYDDKSDRVFSADDRYLLQLIAANVSTAVQLFRSRLAQERAERLTTIGRLLSSVIHDLKTPMTVISGYTQLMVAADDPKVRSDYSEFILKQFQLIQQMQREVLEFARGERTILIRRVYLQSFMRSFEQSLVPELEGSPVTLRVELDDRGVARFDEGKVTRALHNLVRNAIEAMGERGGKLTIRVRREAQNVIFSVSDTGPGIPKAIRSKLFQSFVTAGKKGGTGLGLAIVKKIVDEHSGQLEVRTSSRGTTFSFSIPQAP